MEAHLGQTYQLSRIGHIYQTAYTRLAGNGVKVKPWHFQWLGAYSLQRDLKARLGAFRGRLLDVGCGQKPYGDFLHSSVEHVGVDVVPGPKVDVVIDGVHLPFPDQSFDAILCTQVMEHAAYAEEVRDEMVRCLRPGGTIIITVPFIYNEHGAPDDFRRLSRYGVVQLFEQGVEITEVSLQGGIGSTLGLLVLNWYDAQMDHFKVTRLLKGLTLPVFLVVSFLINMAGYLLDKIDRTEDFYHNVLLVGVKRGQ